MNQLLLCGGASGHLQHVVEDRSLTFAEIKDIFQKASQGKLQKVSEKLDGMNLVFTFDNSTNQLKVARSGGDISRGGMDAATLAKKFFGRGNIEEAFNKSFKILNAAISSLSDSTRSSVFGDNGNKWYAMEIIYSETKNTINYDSNNIVFHSWPVFEVDENGKVNQTNDDTGVDELSKNIDLMQKAIGERDWRVRGPSLLRMKNHADGSIAKNAIARLDQAMNYARVSDNNTLYDYLAALIVDDVKALNLSDDITNSIIERSVNSPDCPSIIDIKKSIPKERKEEVGEFIKQKIAESDKNIGVIADIIHDFAIEVLKGLQSSLISKSDEEVQRLRAQVTQAIKAIEASGNETALEILKKEMLRLKSVENVSAPMEGIVFFYKGNAYKFTGAFAPAHQILSLFKYGRKGIKLNTESINHVNLFEGGHAVSNVSSISLQDLETTWPYIEQTLKRFGITKIEPVGSTFKKDLMGDVDVAVQYDGDRGSLSNDARNLLGQDAVKVVGSNVVSIRHPVYTMSSNGAIKTSDNVQIDMMIGDVDYVKWGRWGASTIKDNPDYSLVKGVLRNIFLNSIIRKVSELKFPEKHTELDRERYTLDFDNGLFYVVQTKRNKTPGKPPTKEWKTIDRKLITKSPDEIIKLLFGSKFNSGSIKSFENLVDALKKSSNTKDIADEVLITFLDELHNHALKSPEMFGGDPNQVIRYVEEIVYK